MPVLSLKRRGSELAAAANQVEILSSGDLVRFDEMLKQHELSTLIADQIEILQVNVGKLCNMTCQHCHVDAGPDRKVENMDRATVDACLKAIAASDISTLDLTGGAPEMNPHFKYFVSEARKLGCHVIDRCNLTILLANGFTDMPQFLADNEVEIVASLPCYLEENADSQRGDGSFQKSIKALQILNELGYGKPDSKLSLTLVYNPVGASLPPSQESLEQAYREQLQQRYGIEFTRLFTITNMPISRYLDHLLESNQYDDYMQKLIEAFNPAAALGVMCRQTLSVSWEGRLYDCDFNQMLELGVESSSPATIDQFDATTLNGRKIVTGRHCFGCTAGAGSGCQGAIS
ncbi:arsenosugar biosynthesis radical SAM (seleno)protein ArsS [Mariniblastus fucicola]